MADRFRLSVLTPHAKIFDGVVADVLAWLKTHAYPTFQRSPYFGALSREIEQELQARGFAAADLAAHLGSEEALQLLEDQLSSGALTGASAAGEGRQAGQGVVFPEGP